MLTRMAAVVFIFLCIAAAWAVLGNTVATRTAAHDESLKTAVGQLWGTRQRQFAPQIQYQTARQSKVEMISHPLLLDGSDIKVDLNLDHRQNGACDHSSLHSHALCRNAIYRESRLG